MGRDVVSSAGEYTFSKKWCTIAGIERGGGVVDRKEVKMEVKVGDQVIYSKYSGTEVKLDDEEYIIVKQSDILAIIQ